MRVKSEGISKGKVKFSLCLAKYHTMNAYRGGGYRLS